MDDRKYQAMDLDDGTYKARHLAVLYMIESRLADLDLTMRRMAGQGAKNEAELRRENASKRDDGERVFHDLDNDQPPSFARAAHTHEQPAVLPPWSSYQPETFCSVCGPLDEPGVHTQRDCPRYDHGQQAADEGHRSWPVSGQSQPPWARCPRCHSADHDVREFVKVPETRGRMRCPDPWHDPHPVGSTEDRLEAIEMSLAAIRGILQRAREFRPADTADRAATRRPEPRST